MLEAAEQSFGLQFVEKVQDLAQQVVLLLFFCKRTQSGRVEGFVPGCQNLAHHIVLEIALGDHDFRKIEHRGSPRERPGVELLYGCVDKALKSPGDLPAIFAQAHHLPHRLDRRIFPSP